MSITFSSGGFDGTMRSDASGNIFIETTGNSKTIRIGGIKEYTGSIERTIDKTTGKVENEVERNIGAGKITYRSGSGNTANQIEFEQTENGAFIHLSGSIPGYNIISTAPAARYRLIRQSFDQFVDANDNHARLWWNGIVSTQTVTYNGVRVATGSFVFSKSTNQGTPVLVISESGDVVVTGKLFAQEYHTEVTSASIIYQSGSTQFGNSADDTHTFQGNITASGNISTTGDISASGDIYGEDDLFLRKDLSGLGPIIYQRNDHAAGITGLYLSKGDADDATNLNKGFLDYANASKKLNLINYSGPVILMTSASDGLVNRLYVSQSGVVGIGNSNPPEKLTVEGNISASGQYYGEQIIVTHHLADIAETTERFIPAPSYFVDAAANNYTTRWIAPYDGELEKVLANSSGTPGSTVISLYAGTGGANKKDSVTVNMSSADTTYTFNCTSGSTISAGDLVRVSYNASADSDEVSFTCVWKYKIT